ncbi:unnamed protein product [Brassicogethes aeneus]|uniref:Uncharacterized protein n=1 Tax=Brassicogethes aeneus TaxID=1431903 RepID=A0A9P0F8C2_BRAAE|nr:unnamed protein product [Brassicogethes aeneus]
MNNRQKMNLRKLSFLGFKSSSARLRAGISPSRISGRSSSWLASLDPYREQERRGKVTLALIAAGSGPACATDGGPSISTGSRNPRPARLPSCTRRALGQCFSDSASGRNTTPSRRSRISIRRVILQAPADKTRVDSRRFAFRCFLRLLGSYVTRAGLI